MIARKVRLHELLRRTCGDGSIAFAALISIDEGAAVTLRLSAEEHAVLESAMLRQQALAMMLRVGPPSLRDLVSREAGEEIS